MMLNRMPSAVAVALLIVLAALTGCGSDETPVTPDVGTEQTFVYTELSGSEPRPMAMRAVTGGAATSVTTDAAILSAAYRGRVAILEFRDGPRWPSHVVIANTDGTDRVVVATASETVRIENAAIAPDGERALVVLNPLGTDDPRRTIAVVSRTAPEPVPIATDMRGGTVPAFSPDGQWIAYARGPVGGGPPRATLVVVRTDGSDRRDLVEAIVPYDLWRSVSWTADSKAVIYSENFADETEHDGIRVVDVATGAVRSLGPSETAPGFMPHAEPGGGLVAYSRRRDTTGTTLDLAVMNADGTSPRTVATAEPGYAYVFGSVSANGRYVLALYLNTQSDDIQEGGRLVIVEIGTGARTVVAERVPFADWSR